MTIEHDLREALAAEADGIEPAPDAWRRVVENAAAGEQQRRRKLWLGGGAMATGLAAVVAVMAVTVLQNDETPVRTIEPANDPTTTQPAPPTTTAPEAKPSEFVAYRSNGQIVIVMPHLGTERVLATAKYDPVVHPRRGNVSVNNTHVFYDATDGVWQVPRAGGAPTRIGPGYIPSVSPDGTTLAYGKTNGTSGDRLVLRDLASGREKVLGGKPNRSFSTVSWSDSSTRLSIFWRSQDADGLMNIDPRTAASLDDAVEVADPATSQPDDGFSYEAPLGDEAYVAVHRCCLREAPVGTGMEWDESWHRLAIVSDDAKVRSELVDLGDKAVSALRVSPYGTGHYITYVIEDRELWGWFGGNDKPVLLGPDYLSAVIPHFEF